MDSLQHIRIVLVRPEQAGNVGAAARALKNMGLSDLALVTPFYSDDTEAYRLAPHAEDILDGAQRFTSLAAALADCRWCVATTRRLGARRAAAYTPRSLAAEVFGAPTRRPLALVFGPERDGLAGAELDLCPDVLHIPATPAQPSLNLAQAVLLVAYELYVASSAAPAPTPPGPEATAGALEAMYAQLRAVMLATGFASPATVAHRMRRVRRLLARARPLPDEVTLLRGLWRQALWAARGRRDDS